MVFLILCGKFCTCLSAPTVTYHEYAPAEANYAKHKISSPKIKNGDREKGKLEKLGKLGKLGIVPKLPKHPNQRNREIREIREIRDYP